MGNADANTLDGRAGADVLLGGAGMTSMSSTMPSTRSTSLSYPAPASIRCAVRSTSTYARPHDGSATRDSGADRQSSHRHGQRPRQQDHRQRREEQPQRRHRPRHPQAAPRRLLQGGNGFDTLDGGAGGDTLVGGEDGDIYVVDSKLDIIIDKGTIVDPIVTSKISVDLSACRRSRTSNCPANWP